MFGKAEGQDMHDRKEGASLTLREARVVAVDAEGDDIARLKVLIPPESEPAPAVAYRAITPQIAVGDRVIVNTTAVDLGLGTGGVHFVLASLNSKARCEGSGHIMKLRYTPLQLKVLAAEEEASPHHELFSAIPDLGGKPVAVGSLHSMAPIVAAGIKGMRPSARIAYVMTDGAALPCAFSRLVAQMKAAGLIEAVITAGHAFGGDLEAVTVASAIAAAHSVLGADAIIVAMGPGVVGTGTPLGSTALEVGPILDAAGALKGTPIAIPRLSCKDPRERHRGISHHTMTALLCFTHVRACVPLPKDAAWRDLLEKGAQELAMAGLEVLWKDGASSYRIARSVLRESGINVTTMGRDDGEDPLFFHGAAVAAAAAAERM